MAQLLTLLPNDGTLVNFGTLVKGEFYERSDKIFMKTGPITVNGEERTAFNLTDMTYINHLNTVKVTLYSNVELKLEL